MDRRRLEISGGTGLPIGHLELHPVDPREGDLKIVIQLHPGYQVLALRGEMRSGRISGILGRPAPLPPPDAPPAPEPLPG